MKNRKLISKVSFVVACLLGMGGLTIMASASNKEVLQAEAIDSSDGVAVTNVIDFTNTTTGVGENSAFQWSGIGEVYKNGSIQWFTIPSGTTKAIFNFNKHTTYATLAYKYVLTVKYQVVGTGTGPVNLRVYDDFGEISYNELTNVDTTYNFSNVPITPGVNRTAITFEFTKPESSVIKILSSFSIQVFYSDTKNYKASITKGTGISAVKVSNANDGTGLVNSGTYLYKGAVYGYAYLDEGYAPQSTWTLISDNLYRVGSLTIDSANVNFGTINAVVPETTISFDQQGGIGGATGNVIAHSGLNMPSLSGFSAPTKTGYIFTGYFDEIEGGNKYYNNDLTSAKKWNKADSEATLYAQWEIVTTPLTFDQNGGTGGASTSTPATYGQEMPTLTGTAPTKNNYTFLGYFDASNGGTKYYNADLTSAKNWDKETTNETTLYAQYKLNGTTITLDKQGGTGGSDDASGVKDQVLPDITIPTKAGYTFNGYYEQTGGQGQQYYGNNGKSSFTWTSEAVAATIYASWTIKPAVQAAIDKINAIGEVNYPGSKAKIEAARNAYDNLATEDKEAVSNRSTLFDDETLYESLMIQGVDKVKDLIDDIGTVVYPDSKDDIDAARNGYDALTEEQKALVTNYNTLTEAEKTYKDLEDQAQANATIDLINEIGTVEYKETCKAKIDAARTAYDALSTEGKALVTNYQKLTDAEAQYKYLADIEEVKALINNIGKVELTEACKAKIEAANNAYKALTEEQKELITNKKVLFDAIELYDILAHQPEVKENGVEVKGKDGELIPVNVNIKVEVKTTIQAQEGTVEYEKIQNMLASNEKIAGVYDVKLIRTIDGKEEVIQPSDIKEGMVISVEITLPDGLLVEGLKVLHIHNENDITFIENYSIEGNKLTFDTDRLSEFAFVTLNPNARNGLPAWAIVLIIIGGLLLTCCLLLVVLYLLKPVYYVDYSSKEVRKAIKIKKHHNEVLMLNTKLKKIRRNEVDVYESKEEALEALKK